jgi:hypothetical protein
MAHEIGHMFGGIHTFTPITTQECAQAAVPPEGRVEPGSGSTIMSYAAACGSDKLFTGEPNSAANSFFHIHTMLRIRDHKAAFPLCGQTLNSGNSPPVITNPGTGGFIPAFTPFMLTAAATDRMVIRSLTRGRNLISARLCFALTCRARIRRECFRVLRTS